MKVLVIGADQTMSSLEIAELTGKRHDNVMRDIMFMLNELEIDTLRFEDVSRNHQNQQVKSFNLPKRECLILVSGYNLLLRTAIIDRWQSLELENARLKSQEQERVADRQAARLECHAMTDSLQEIRAEAGKGTKGFHYSNEMEMINRIVLGMTAKKYRVAHKINSIDAIRDRLNLFQVKMVQLLQATNTALIQCDISYKERRKKLALLYEREAKKLAIK